MTIWFVAACAAAFILATNGCVRQALPAESKPLVQLNTGLPSADASLEEWNLWTRQADAERAARGEPMDYWLAPKLNRAWRIPACLSLPSGGLILDGHCEGRPACEADRADLRVVVICLGGSPRRTLSIMNGGERNVLLWSIPGSRDLLLALSGHDWRFGDSLDLLAVDPCSCRVESVFECGGSEDCAEPGIELTASTTPELAISGICRPKWPAYRQDLDQVEERFRVKVHLR